jgi:hypothetical protein
MRSTIVLSVLGTIMLILGIMSIVVSTKYIEWEDKEYKNLKHKDAPKNLKHTTMTVGVILTVLGSLMLLWSAYIHMYPRSAVKAGLAVTHTK